MSAVTLRDRHDGKHRAPESISPKINAGRCSDLAIASLRLPGTDLNAIIVIDELGQLAAVDVENRASDVAGGRGGEEGDGGGNVLGRTVAAEWNQTALKV